MKERPILFTGEMVRAILDGRKTQTRRPVKFGKTAGISPEFHHLDFLQTAVFTDGTCVYSPFGTVGDRLWVRETFADQHPLAIQDGRYSQPGRAGIPGPPPVEYRTIYRVDGEPNQIWRNGTGLHPYFEIKEPSAEDLEFATIRSNYTNSGRAVHWRPSIHMPRWASRIDLEITAVRVERVQDITEEDAKKEGVNWKSHVVDEVTGNLEPYEEASDAFKRLWQSIYGNRPKLPADTQSKRYKRVIRWLENNPPTDWDANPWVWVYEFRRVRP